MVQLRPLPVAPTYTLTLRLNNPNGGVTIGNPSTAVITVTQAVAAGYLDSTFGNAGEVFVPARTAKNDFNASLILADGSTLGAGYEILADGSSTPAIVLSKVNPNGTLDTAFGINGSGLIPVTAPYALGLTNIVVQPDGKILVGGYVAANQIGGKNINQFMVARFDSSGLPDTTFGKNGVVVAPSTVAGQAETPLSVSVLSSGQILEVGNVELANRVLKIELKRFNANGTLDTTFSTSGTVLISTTDSASAAVAQPDGKILVGGPSAAGPATLPLFLQRFNTNGTLDTSFGTGGTVTGVGVGGPEQSGPTFVEPNGDILQEEEYPGVFSGLTASLVRYLPTGQVDTSFGTAGFSNNGVIVNQLAVQPDGKILEYGGNNTGNTVLARLNADGSPDFNFGFGGMLLLGTTQGGYYDGQGHIAGTNGDLSVVPGNKILVVGQSGDSSGPVVIPGEGLNRYNMAPPPLAVRVDPLAAATGVALSNVTVATYTDPETPFEPDGVTATIHWGDGSAMTTGTVVANPGGSFSVVGSHTYAGDGSYPISVEVANEIDLRSGEGQGTAKVGGPAVKLVVTTPPPINEERNGAFGFVVSAEDSAGHVQPELQRYSEPCPQHQRGRCQPRRKGRRGRRARRRHLLRSDAERDRRGRRDLDLRPEPGWHKLHAERLPGPSRLSRRGQIVAGRLSTHQRVACAVVRQGRPVAHRYRTSVRGRQP